MGDWYRVVKTIKGYRYLYEQRTRREGQRVRTENRYLGHLGDRGARVPPGEGGAVTTTGSAPRLAYHGAREGIVGPPEPSPSGRFGPGFYLTTRERAALYAAHDPKWAAKWAANRSGRPPPEPRYDGTVHAFDVGALRLKVLETWDAYFDLVDGLLEVDQGYATTADKARVQELLAAQGYDGLEVRDPDRTETVVFPPSVHKLQAAAVTTTDADEIEGVRREEIRRLPRYTEGRSEPLPGIRRSRRGGTGAVLREEAMPAPSLYATVTQNIIDELKAGTVPWVKPWQGGLGAGGAGCLPCNVATGRSYSGVNVLTLWAAAQRKGYPSQRWLTFNQAREAGGRVRKGEKGTAVVFTKQIEVEDETGEGEGSTRRIPILRTFTVFNVAQVAGLPEEFYAVPRARPEGERHAAAEALVRATGAEIRHGGDTAAYLPGPDVVILPPAGAFESAEHYYATELHELGHWSGHERRLYRDLKNRFGSRAYAAEELIAELTAAFLCAELGIEGRLRHADYIGHWLELLENDHRAIFTAASKASRAAEYLKGFAAPPEAA